MRTRRVGLSSVSDHQPDRRDILKLTLQGLIAFTVAPSVAFGQDLLGGTRQYSASYGATVNEFEAINLTLQQDLIDLTRHTTIRCDVLTISGSIKTGGKNLTLLARRVTFANAAIIDARGPLPVHDYDPASRAIDGQSPGQDGGKGADGDPGTAGGTVTLIAKEILGLVSVDTSGQKGGTAQSGGNGAKGGVGATGPHPGDAGGSGGTGGRGGLAGVPGKGGDAGSITIASVTQLDRSSVTLVAKQGDAGSSAHHGAPGGPGPGGAGGAGNVFAGTICSAPSKAR